MSAAIKHIRALYSGQSFSETIAELGSGIVTQDRQRGLLDHLYKDALMQQAVETPVQDMLSEWRDIQDKTLRDLDSDLNVQDAFMSAAIQARIYGSSMIIPVIVDSAGNRVATTTTVNRLADASGFSVLRLVVVSQFSGGGFVDNDVRSDNYGHPSFYTVNGGRISASRCLILQANNAGTSFIESILDYYCDFKDRNAETTRAVKEANFLAFGTDLKMLVEMANARAEAAGGSAEAIVGELIRDRLRDLRRNANNSGAWGYDKESEVVDQVSKSNIKSMIESVDQAAKFLGAAADIPASRFLGVRQSSLSGDGGDAKNYNQTLVGLRSKMVEPALNKFDALLSKIYPQIKSLEYSWRETAIIKQ